MYIVSKNTHAAVYLLSFSQIEEVPGEMTQDDLATDDVMILDTWEQVKKPELVCCSWSLNSKSVQWKEQIFINHSHF